MPASSTTQVSLPPNTAPVSMAMRLWRTTGDFHRGVAVHDDGAEISLGVEERLARPQQVVAGLVFQGDTWADAGMDEGIAAFAVHQDQVAKEVLVRLRDQRRPLVARSFRVDAVALQRRLAPGEQPVRPGGTFAGRASSIVLS